MRAIILASCLLVAAAAARADVVVTAASVTPAKVTVVQDDGVVFYDELAPYGAWWESPRYGWVWSPNVDVTWRPYTVGHWVFTDYGWTWVSGEPFGWAVFHYGRWVFVDDAGWVWVPGSTWGPAWVAWRSSPSVIGWGPLGPADVVAFGPDGWVFVDEPRFLAVDIVSVAIPIDRAPRVLSTTRVVRRPARTDVERATGRPVAIHRVVRDAATARPGDVVMPRASRSASTVRQPSTEADRARDDAAQPAPQKRALQKHRGKVRPKH